MNWLRRYFGVTPRREKLVGVLLLIAVLSTVVPTPSLSIFIPKSTSGKDLSRPFPCQSRACGCRTAEQCKQKCCCFTDEQKRVWARRNGAQESDVVSTAVDSKKQESVACKACCSSNRSGKSTGECRLPKSPTKSTLRYWLVIGVVAQECHGVALTLTGQPAFVLPPNVFLRPQVTQRGKRLIPQDIHCEQFVTEPPVPPPKRITPQTAAV